MDRFNERRRGLARVIEFIRQDYRERQLDPSDNVRLMDSGQ